MGPLALHFPFGSDQQVGGVYLPNQPITLKDLPSLTYSLDHMPYLVLCKGAHLLDAVFDVGGERVVEILPKFYGPVSGGTVLTG